MSRRARTALFVVAGALLAAMLAWALTGLPDFGHYQGRYGRIVAKSATSERAATNSVVVATFDYRGVDTLGEEFILFAAATAVAVLLRAGREERRERERAEREERIHPASSESMRLLGAGLVGPFVVFGIYIVSHGALTPGGGFQGGVILMAATLLVFFAGNYLAFERLRPIALLELGEGVGAAGFALIGLGGLIFSGVFFDNFIAKGTKGSLLSGGVIPLSNIAVGLEVAGALLLVVSEFLDQRLLAARGSRR